MEIITENGRYKVRFYYTNEKTGEKKRFQLSNREWTTDAIKKKEFILIASQAIADKQRELVQEEKAITKEENTIKAFINKFIEFDSTMSKGTTSENKEMRLRKYLGGKFGMDSQVKDVFTTKNMMDFRLWIASLNLSNDTSNHILITTKQFIDYLISAKAIDGSEGYSMKSSLVSLKKKDDEILSEEEEVGENFWTKEEVYRFLDTFEKDDPYRFLFYISFWCATRIGETLGLRFSDFDAPSCTVSIARSRNNHARITTTKTTNSKARIVVPAHVFANLESYRLSIKSDAPTDYLFFPSCHASRTTIRRILYAHADKAGLHRITPHGFRHSMASYLLSQGYDYMDVCKYLRHASPDITLKVYSHWIQKKGNKGFEDLTE